jgi:hypothetical protein
MKANLGSNNRPLLAVAMTICGFVAGSALAETPPAYKLDNATLGRMDALLTACSKADQKHKAAYDQYRTEFIEFGAGEQRMRVEGSDTPEYKEAYGAAVEALGKATTEALAAECVRTIGLDANAEK